MQLNLSVASQIQNPAALCLVLRQETLWFHEKSMRNACVSLDACHVRSMQAAQINIGVGQAKRNPAAFCLSAALLYAMESDCRQPNPEPSSILSASSCAVHGYHDGGPGKSWPSGQAKRNPAEFCLVSLVNRFDLTSNGDAKTDEIQQHSVYMAAPL
jgi:hypothetical protein